jgi:gliding motility-associated-like protein
MKPFLQLWLSFLFLAGVPVAAIHGQTACGGMVNYTITQPAPFCITTAPTTVAQPEANAIFPGILITYDWEMSTSSATSGFTSLSAASRDLPMPTLPGTYYFKRIASLPTFSLPIPTPPPSCESNVVKVVIVAPPSLSANSPASADVCSGAGTSFSIAVSAIGGTASQWQYDDGTGFTNISSGSYPYNGSNTNTLTISNAAGLGNKSFRCTVTSTSNADCQSQSTVFSLHEKPLPVVSPIARTVCESITATGGTAIVDLNTFNSALTASDPGNLLVSWFTSSPRVSISDPASFQFSGTTMLTANVSNGATYCAADAAVALTAKPFPTAITIIQSPASFCSGSYFDVALEGTAQYSWTATAPPEVQGALPGQGAAIHQALTNSGSQRKTVTYTIEPKQNGCAGLPVNVTATVEPEVKKFAVTGGGEICLGNVGATIGLVNSQSGVDYELEQDGVSTGISVSSPGGAFVYPNPVASNGTFTIHATVDGLCETDMESSAIITVRNVPQGTGIISGDDLVCRGSAHTYEASGWTDATDYQWILPTSLRSVREEEQVAEIVAEETGENIEVQLQAVALNKCGAGTSATKTVSIRNNPVVTIEDPAIIIAGQPFSLVYHTSAPLTQWQWNFGDGGAATGQYPEHTYDKPGPYVVSLNAVDENNCAGDGTLNLAATAAISSTDIKNVITANGDSQNGYLIVENLEKFPDNEVVLLSRWGNEVFRKKGYANDWDARVDGYFLPAGNYICIVRLTETDHVFSRVVTVVKD